mgnify:CR=1 FL=1
MHAHDLVVAQRLLKALNIELWAMLLLVPALFFFEAHVVLRLWCIDAAVAILTWLWRKRILHRLELETHCDDDDHA